MSNKHSKPIYTCCFSAQLLSEIVFSASLFGEQIERG